MAQYPQQEDQITSPALDYNYYGPAPNSNPITDNPVDSSSPPIESIEDRMRRLYNPDTHISDLYNQMLMSPPQRTGASGKRAIIGALGGFLTHPLEGDKAAQTADNIIYNPYKIANQDYEGRLKDLAVGANIERNENAQNRLFVQNIATQEYNQAKNEAAATKEANLQKQRDKQNELAQEKLRIQQQRANAYDFSRRNPTWKSYAPKGGNIIFFNPLDPTQQVDTGIDTGTATDLDKANWNFDKSMAEIKARTAGQVQVRETTPGGIKSSVPTYDANRKQTGTLETYNDGTQKFVPLPSGVSSTGKLEPGDTQTDTVVTGPDGKPLGTRSTVIIKDYQKKQKQLDEDAGKWLRERNQADVPENRQAVIKAGKVK